MIERDIWWPYLVQRARGNRWETIDRAVSRCEAVAKTWSHKDKRVRIIAADGETVFESVRCT
jgi:hypothetical protein